MYFDSPGDSRGEPFLTESTSSARPANLLVKKRRRRRRNSGTDCALALPHRTKMCFVHRQTDVACGHLERSAAVPTHLPLLSASSLVDVTQRAEGFPPFVSTRNKVPISPKHTLRSARPYLRGGGGDRDGDRGGGRVRSGSSPKMPRRLAPRGNLEV